MDRRTGGALVIVLALVSVLVVPRILNPVLVTGVAAPAPPPPAPAIGDCIADTDWSSGFDDAGALIQSAPAVFVPCTEPHQGEVSYVNPDFQPAPYNAGQPYGGFDDPCTNPPHSELTYLGLDPTTAHLWEPALATGTRVLGPDARQFAAGQRWAACVITFRGYATVTSTLRDATRRDGPPRALAVCFTGGGANPTDRPALCSGPHAVELLAAVTLPADDPIDQTALDRGCVELADQQAGRPLSNEAGLEVVALTYAFDTASAAPVEVVAPLPTGADGGWSSCLVRAVDGRRLDGSVRQLGTRPLPWAP